MIHFPRLTACLLGGSAALALSACAATTDMAQAPAAPAQQPAQQPARQPGATSPAITSAIPAAQIAAVEAAVAANDIGAFFQAYEEASLSLSPQTKT